MSSVTEQIMNPSDGIKQSKNQITSNFETRTKITNDMSTLDD